MEACFERCSASAACGKSTGNRYFKVYIGIMNVHAVLHGKISLVFGKLQYAVRMYFCQLRIVERLRKLNIGSSEPRQSQKKGLPLDDWRKSYQNIEISNRRTVFVQVFFLERSGGRVLNSIYQLAKWHKIILTA